MLISLAYRVTRKLLGAVAVIAQRDVSKDAELLVLRHENSVVRRHVSGARYEAEDRLWLAALSSLVPRRRWAEVFAVTPATVMAWHRGLIRGKYTAASRRTGRPQTAAAVRNLVIRMATDNPACGHRRVHPIAVSTVWRILNAAGIDPAPRRSGPSWRQFLSAQARGIVAVDFVHVDTVLLNRIYALILIEHGSRRPPARGQGEPGRAVDHPGGPQPITRVIVPPFPRMVRAG